MKLTTKLIILLFIICMMFLSRYKGSRVGIEQERNQYRKIDSIIQDTFRLGCEAASLKKCKPKDQDECKRFCSNYLKDNKKILDILKKKANTVLKN